MKNMLSKILLTLVLTITFFAVPKVARAESYQYTSLTIPTVTAGDTSNSVNQVIKCHKQKDVGLAWTTTSTNTTVRIGAGVNGTRRGTNYFVITFTNAPPPVGGYTHYTNLVVGGANEFVVDSVTSTGTLIATNTVEYSIKKETD